MSHCQWRSWYFSKMMIQNIFLKCCLLLGKTTAVRQKYFPSPLPQGLAQLMHLPKSQGPQAIVNSKSWWDSYLELGLGPQPRAQKQHCWRSSLRIWLGAQEQPEKEWPHWGSTSFYAVQDILEGGKSCMPTYFQICILKAYLCGINLQGSGG